jgi:hypothetical protein
VRASPLLAAALVSLGAGACRDPYPHPSHRGAGSAVPHRGGTLRFAFDSDLTTVDPARAAAWGLASLVLGDPALAAAWRAELLVMAGRVRRMRAELAAVSARSGAAASTSADGWAADGRVKSPPTSASICRTKKEFFPTSHLRHLLLRCRLPWPMLI